MGNEPTTVTRAGVRVSKACSIETRGGARAEFEIESSRAHPVAVKIRERLPEGLDASDIDVCDEHDGERWWVFGDELEFSGVLKPDGTIETAYVARTLVAADGSRPSAPTIETVVPVDPEDANRDDAPLWRGATAEATALATVGNGRRTRNGRPTREGVDTADRSDTTAVRSSETPTRTAVESGMDESSGGDTDAKARSSGHRGGGVAAIVTTAKRQLERLSRSGTVFETEAIEPLSDDAFDVLSNARRRQVLVRLFENDEPARLGDLSRSIAAWENDVSTTEVTSQQRKRVYTALRQSHLPKMDRAGVVNYDKDRGSIELASEAARLRPYLDVSRRRRTRGWRYPLLGVLWCGVIAAVWIGVVPLGPFTGLALACLVGLSAVISVRIPTVGRITDTE